MISFSLNNNFLKSDSGSEEDLPECMLELASYMALLNNGDKDPHSLGELEASASEDYVRKVSKSEVQRSSITFAMFKDIVTNPLVWEKYHHPERPTKAIEECRDSLEIQWEDILYYTAYGSLESPEFFYYSIPLSNSFQKDNLNDLISYIRWDGQSIEQNFEGPGPNWFRILKWLKELSYSSRSSPSCDKDLNTVMEWWHNFNPYPTTGTPPCIRTICETALRANKDGDITLLLPSNPCLCNVCHIDRWYKLHPSCQSPFSDRSLHINDELLVPPFPFQGQSRNPEQYPSRIEDNEHHSQLSDQPAAVIDPATPLKGLLGLLKRKFEEEEPRLQIAPLPRRYRNNTDEDVESATLGPVRKRRKITLSLELDASDTDSIITETNEESNATDTWSEDGMSVDEDFWSAKSRLSLLTIGD